MKTKALKWGNSLAVRIPSMIRKECGIKENSCVEILHKNKQIIITPFKKEYSLKDLLAGVTNDNIHSEFNTGTPEGKEAL